MRLRYGSRSMGQGLRLLKAKGQFEGSRSGAVKLAFCFDSGGYCITIQCASTLIVRSVGVGNALWEAHLGQGLSSVSIRHPRSAT